MSGRVSTWRSWFKRPSCKSRLIVHVHTETADGIRSPLSDLPTITVEGGDTLTLHETSTGGAFILRFFEGNARRNAVT